MGDSEQLEQGGIPRQDDRKPDPSEPWRYVCPEDGGQVAGNATHRRYRCGVCGERWAEDELHDRKGQISQSDKSTQR